MEVDAEVQRTAEALDQRYCAGARLLASESGLLDQMAGDDPIDDAEHLAHDCWTAGEQETQRIDFIFTIKAWQLLTHESSSPTYRRLKEALSTVVLAQAGGFKWNDLTRMAWYRTQEIAEALAAEAIVFQTPRSFSPSRQNLQRLYRFFGQIDRGGRHMAFEPRGAAWDDGTLRSVVTDLNLVHVVDPFLGKAVGSGLSYFRLHGRPAYHYHYRYSDEDLRQLEGSLNKACPNWVLFNNDAMAADGLKFIEHMRRRRLEK